MTAQFESTQSFAANYDLLFSRCQAAIPLCGFVPQHADSSQGILEAKVGATWKSFGENITIKVSENGMVTVHSICNVSTTIVDYGKNKGNVEKFFATLIRQFETDSPIPRVPVPKDRAPAPENQPNHTPESINQGKLRRNLVTHFNETELENLCFDMQIDYESFPAKGKDSMARELVAYCERTERISELVRNCRELRPNVDW